VANNNEITVVQRALLMPEILSTIFKWISPDQSGWWCVYNKEGDEEYAHTREGVLARCGLVNKLWYNEAMRCLWREPTHGFFASSLQQLFAKIDPARRQFYANFIEAAILSTADEDQVGKSDDALSGVTFPKLKSLYMFLVGPAVPKTKILQLAVLEIDPYYDSHPETNGPEIFGLSRAKMDTFLEQIPVRAIHLPETCN
jgi:hypothetical protein